jgi:putative transposase
LKTERTGRKTYRTRDEARADVFDYIERFYNPKRRHSTIGYQRWSCFLRQAVKVDSAMKRVIHHEDAETVFG